jgi:hypothetical protein
MKNGTRWFRFLAYMVANATVGTLCFAHPTKGGALPSLPLYHKKGPHWRASSGLQQ